MAAELKGRRVMVLDDDSLMATLLEDMIEGLGCRVVAIVRNVQEALVALDREAPDLAVLDVNLAGEFCYPVADALASRGVPFAFVTGFRQLHIDQRYRDRPVLDKPFAQSSLEAILKQALAFPGDH